MVVGARQAGVSISWSLWFTDGLKKMKYPVSQFSGRNFLVDIRGQKRMTTLL